MPIFIEERHRWRPPLPRGKKRPIVFVKSPYLPFPSGICKQCWQKHGPTSVRLENGGCITAPESAISKQEPKISKSKISSLADLFWTQEEP
jgi:hypothetical protein